MRLLNIVYLLSPHFADEETEANEHKDVELRASIRGLCCPPKHEGLLGQRELLPLGWGGMVRPLAPFPAQLTFTQGAQG